MNAAAIADLQRRRELSCASYQSRTQRWQDYIDLCRRTRGSKRKIADAVQSDAVAIDSSFDEQEVAVFRATEPRTEVSHPEVTMGAMSVQDAGARDSSACNLQPRRSPPVAAAIAGATCNSASTISMQPVTTADDTAAYPAARSPLRNLAVAPSGHQLQRTPGQCFRQGGLAAGCREADASRTSPLSHSAATTSGHLPWQSSGYRFSENPLFCRGAFSRSAATSISPGFASRFEQHDELSLQMHGLSQTCPAVAASLSSPPRGRASGQVGSRVCVSSTGLLTFSVFSEDEDEEGHERAPLSVGCRAGVTGRDTCIASPWVIDELVHCNADSEQEITLLLSQVEQVRQSESGTCLLFPNRWPAARSPSPLQQVRRPGGSPPPNSCERPWSHFLFRPTY
eukprot:CAMPEP_0119375882 /NCGR_PEP_ID=MMETSP1334-20130426/37112_1 /TAXON_ID=127549 /ORGANISM="Calcidiscus leptoporus, Strain RCC1130" /LENGTH=396 /DNA_ID=CAMNT_0007394293 /DNA_START=141 /DNA_END=1331 /DNA_ORIENTATION=+